MALHKIKLPTEEVPLSGGTTLTVRGLSRGEAYLFATELQKLEDLNDAEQGVLSRDIESQLISWATDSTLSEAREWCDNSPLNDVTKVSEVVVRLSGLDESPKE